MNWRSKKLTQSAKHESCVSCGAPECCWCHSNEYLHGKGRGIKADDDIINSPDALLIVDKQRHGEWEGKIGLYFHKQSFRYVETINAKTWPTLKF